MNSTTQLRVAYGSVPKEGGTFTFYKNHRAEFARLGIELLCVAIGAEQADLWNETFADDGCVLLAPQTRSMLEQAKAFVRWCESERINAVIPVNSPGILSAVPHLPEQMRVVSRCANALAEGYEFAAMNRQRISSVIALTPRLRDDLIKDYAVPASMLQLIPNGVDMRRFDRPPGEAPEGGSQLLRLAFLGRLEHKQKGVLYLPDIVDHLHRLGVPFELSIAGEGVHKGLLLERLSPHITSGRVKHVGLLGSDQVPAFLHRADVYLFTSHFEGCPNSLLEAMAAGCVPASWIIPGITDFIIESGRTGVLVEMGDCAGLAQEVARLAINRDQVTEMSSRTRVEAQERFSLEECARRYQDVLLTAMSTEPEDLTVRPWSEFEIPPRFRRRLGWLPDPIRRLLRSGRDFSRRMR